MGVRWGMDRGQTRRPHLLALRACAAPEDLAARVAVRLIDVVVTHEVAAEDDASDEAGDGRGAEVREECVGHPAQQNARREPPAERVVHARLLFK